MPEFELRHRVLAAVLAACLLAYPATDPLAATGPVTITLPALPEAAPPASGGTWSRMFSPELMAQGAGALLGYGAYVLFLAPSAAVVDSSTTAIGYRLVASSLAGAGAVAATYAYDVSTGQPVNYAYFWHRGGFIVGVAAGVVAFAALGNPAGAGTTWLAWAINRSALVGTGLLAAWGTDRWYRGTTDATK
jgi:hypothetical protein